MASIDKTATHHEPQTEHITLAGLEQGPDVPVTVAEAVQIADTTENIRYSPWTKSMFRHYLCLLVAYFGACTNGYDGSVMGGLNAMTSYQEHFHMLSASSSTGLIFAIYNFGTIAALPFVGPTNDYLGRRAGIFTGAVIVIAGSCIVAQAADLNMFMGGRFVLGFGVAFLNVSSPIYVGEMAHPAWRGTLMGIYNAFWGLGSIAASWVVYAAQYRGKDGWRLPLYCQLIAAGILFVCVWFLPESPRWLMAHGRPQAAREILARHHGEGDENHPLVKLEMAEMEIQISTEGSDKRWWDYRELWRTRAARRRLLCVLTMAFFAQWCGNSVTSYYMPVMLENAGITSEQKKLMLNAIYAVITFITALIGARLVDLVGRRVLLLSTLGFCILCFGIITPTSKYADKNPNNSTTANVSIAFIYLFGISYSFGWTPLSPMYIVEVLDTNTRAKGKSLAQLATAAASAIIQYSSGPAFENIKYYFYLVFIAWDIIEFTVIYFFWPETRGRTLEELQEVFEAKDPVKKSLEPKTIQTVIATINAEK
ncbi:general substrate transporter [Diplogelasinospora grovesii]|uniref:General substrate transporter n=1 Tax=Diplogelasinospora grovesii TaxID=303347 RepID=A0AAN6MYQ4_9PEZI|nr:general substrate transporter [Diplogelasinospora grovesii]